MSAKEDAEALRKAMKGFGCDEGAIIKIIANRTSDQRQEIKKVYNSIFDRDLIKDLKSELHGRFEDGVLALFVPPIEYDADELRKAMKGLGTNEDTLIEIIASRSIDQLKAIKKKYKEKYKKELEESIISETSGNFKTLLVGLLKCLRSTNMKPNMAECELKAKKLYEAGEDQWGKDCVTFNKIFTLSSPFELAYICRVYYKLYGHSIIDAVNKEFHGDQKRLLRTIIHASVCPSEYFATRIYDAIKGWGARDNLLIRILVTRDEIDMPIIKKYFKQLYGKDLVESVKKETYGDYKDLLVELCSH